MSDVRPRGTLASTMNSVERVECVLAGRLPDRPPFSFWCHFAADCVWGQRAVEAHMAHVEAFGVDFLKVMNDNGFPSPAAVNDVRDLRAVGRPRGDEPEFARQLELLMALRSRLGRRMLMITTVFNAWSVLRQMIRRPAVHRPPVLDAAADEPSAIIRGMLRQDEALVSNALERISEALAGFVRRCLAAGADGIFLSVRDDWVEPPASPRGVYERLVRATDLHILRAAEAARFNMLHICGRAADFSAFARYPVHAINWADRAAGPSISEVAGRTGPALCAGVDNLETLPRGRPEDVEREVADAVSQAGRRPIIIAPGCTYDPDAVPRENLLAIRRAAERARY